VARQSTGIYRSIELRDYTELEKIAKEVVSERGWNEFLRILSESQRKGANIPGWNLSVRSGSLRDALVHLLKLENIVGLDCDYIHSFDQIESHDLIDVRKQSFQIIIDLLHKQVENRNTFFLDTGTFSTTPYAVFVKDIINARTAEIEELPSKPSLRQVYSTYYGFMILSSGRISNRHAGATDEGVKCIEDLASQLGKQTKLNARIFQPSRKAFMNCTSETKELLWNILRMFNGGYDTRSTAVKKLGELGDSRATDYIITNLQNTTNRYFKPALLKALGSLGDPKGLDSILEYLNDSSLRKAAILALGGIRHPNALGKLMQIKNSNNRHDLSSVVTAIGIVRTGKAIEILSSFLSSRNGRIVQKSVEAFCSIGKEGLDILAKTPSKLADLLKCTNKSIKLIKILKGIPTFRWTSELQKAIAQAINRNRYRVQHLIKEVNRIPELAASEVVIDGLLKCIKRIPQYSWRGWLGRRLLNEGSIQYFLANAIRNSMDYQRILSAISKIPELNSSIDIRSAIEYAKNKSRLPRLPVLRQTKSIKRVIAKQKPPPKQPTTVQQSLLDYLKNLVKIDIEYCKLKPDEERLRR
jgi:hypothetical protein